MCAMNQIHTHGKACVGQVKGVSVWFNSNEYSWEGLCSLYCLW